MHNRASSLKGAVIACVGQASMHKRHSPQERSSGVSGAKSRVVITLARNTHDPSPLVMSMVFLPINPSPARCARARSRSGPVSTNVRHSISGAMAFKYRTKPSRRFLMTLW